MGFSRQEHWSGLPFSPPGDLPNPEIIVTSPTSPALAGRFFIPEPPGKPLIFLLSLFLFYPNLAFWADQRPSLHTRLLLLLLSRLPWVSIQTPLPSLPSGSSSPARVLKPLGPRSILLVSPPVWIRASLPSTQNTAQSDLTFLGHLCGSPARSRDVKSHRAPPQRPAPRPGSRSDLPRALSPSLSPEPLPLPGPPRPQVTQASFPILPSPHLAASRKSSGVPAAPRRLGSVPPGRPLWCGGLPPVTPPPLPTFPYWPRLHCCTGSSSLPSGHAFFCSL